MDKYEIDKLNNELNLDFELIGFNKPKENDVYEMAEIVSNIIRFRELTINSILTNYKTKLGHEILKSAFKNQYVRIADAVLINFEEGFSSFEKHFNFYLDDLKNERFAISLYMQEFEVDCDKYVMKGEIYYKEFEKFINEYLYIAEDISVFKILFNTAFEYITRCCIFDIVIDAINTENEKSMIICRAEKQFKKAKSAVEAMKMEANVRGWMIDSTLLTILQLEEVLYKEKGIVDELIDFLLYRANPKRLPDTMYFMYKYLFQKTVELVISYGQSYKKNIIFNYDINKFYKEQKIDLPERFHSYVRKTFSISAVLSQTNNSFSHYRSMDGGFDVEKELTESIRFIPKIALHYAISKNMHNITIPNL